MPEASREYVGNPRERMRGGGEEEGRRGRLFALRGLGSSAECRAKVEIRVRGTGRTVRALGRSRMDNEGSEFGSDKAL